MKSVANKNISTMENINTTQKPKFYTVREAADLVDGVSDKLIRKMCKEGKIVCLESGNRFLMTIDALYRGLNIPVA
jgi:hypothetical protein